ncbi:MAG TPA: oligoendopeptidase F, partial [Candidatus Sumerlaeota bacterium]|nr:oligoendopeptidase F [Candidatus Sumerlaeota bacterium]
LYSYAMLRSDEDMANNDNRARKDRITAKGVEIGTRLSWVLPEILGHPESELKTWAQSSLLSKYRRDMQQILRQKPHTLSEKEEKLLSGAGEILAAPSRTFGILTNADMRFPAVKDSAGVEQPLSPSRYLNFLLDHDRSVRQRAFETLFDTYGSYRNTLASTLGSHVKTHNYVAAARNFPSALEAALHPDHVPVSVYDGMIAAAHQALPIFYNYMDLRNRSLKLTKSAMFDMSVSIVPEWEIQVPYEQACQWIVEACKPLGEEYTTALQSAFKDRWVDVYENQNKRSGAYSEGCYDSLPYILTNYQGTLDSLFTLAHELGHSMHTWLSNKYQPPRTAGYPIFIAEIPSTLNEGLLLRYLLETQKEPRFRASLLNQYCDTFRGTVYRQTMFAEFEKTVHEKDAQGDPLMPDTLEKIYFDLNSQFYGPGVEYDEDKRIGREWSRIPHFYYDFYVYKYATCYCASQIFLKRIEESAAQRDQYLELLKSGSQDDPLVLIQKAGVDLTKPETLRSAFETFDKKVAELDETLKKL